MFPKGKGYRVSLFIISGLLLTIFLTACGDNPSPTASTISGTTASSTTSAATTQAATTQTGTTTAGNSTPANNYKISVNVSLSGSGASFPDKAYQKWVSNFIGTNPSVKMTYQSVGSGAGRKAFFSGDVDFAGSDAYPTKTELAAYGDPVITIPTTISGVTVSYNLPGISELRLSPEILGGMYTGKIKNWSDPAIKAENPSQNLPDLAISFAVRSDSSGTSDIFSNYLANVSPDFKALNIAGSQPEWDKGGIQVTKGAQNPGVAAAIKANVGMVGYVDFGDALSQQLVFASLKNQSGQYVTPGPESFSHAEPVGGIPDDLQLVVLNSANPQAYPITATSWILLPKEIKDKNKAEALVTFLWWITHNPQQISAVNPIGFASLPASTLPKIEAALKSVTSGGQTVLR